MSHNVPKIKVSYSHNVPASQRPKIQCSQDAVNVFLAEYDAETIEHIESVYMIVMNRANRVLGIAKLADGGTTFCLMDVKVILQIALETNACSFIIAHNHPSGNLEPYSADIEMTSRIKEAGKVMEISLLDHVIVTPEHKYYSFADEGKL